MTITFSGRLTQLHTFALSQLALTRQITSECLGVAQSLLSFTAELLSVVG